MHSAPAPIAVNPDRASAAVWIAVLAAMIGAFMAILNIQITNASLLNIEGGIGTGVDNGSWISTSYLIGGGGRLRGVLPNARFRDPGATALDAADRAELAHFLGALELATTHG